MSELPSWIATDTVTFFFTDIEGSTRLLHGLGEGYAALLETHHELLRTAFQAHGGHEVETMGDGFFVVFQNTASAVAAAAQIQRTLHEFSWPTEAVVRVRIGLHSGEPVCTDMGFIGLDLHIAARVMAAAHGGQVLLTQASRNLLGSHLPQGVQLRDLGEHSLRDLPRPQHLFHLAIEGVPSDFPPLATISNRPQNLPIPPTPLIGRDQEMQTASALLRRPEVRLLTFTGPGGAGKTRLSLQLAHEFLNDYQDGVFCVLLAPLNDAATVIPTIARTLQVPEIAGLSLSESLREFLRPKQLLLVLDNFEQVLAAAPSVAELLTACPQLKILVTSRASLHLRGEHEFAVPPLALPDPNAGLSLQTLSQYAAVQLFIQRVQAVQPQFVVTEETAPIIAEICARLDGLPLAIELAAARMRLFSPAALLERLKNRLQILTGGAKDLPERHQTLRNAIAWSYDLLQPEEQRIFRRLAVFPGGCSLDSAQEVVALQDETVLVWDAVESLLGHSLLRSETTNGEPRFVMLQTIREYALEQLAASGEQEALQRQHAVFFADLAQHAGSQLTGADQAQWIAQLDTEYDNLRTALAWLENHEPEIGLRLSVALWPYWLLRGRFATGRQGIETLLKRAQEGGEVADTLRAQALYSAGRLAWFQADYVTAQEYLTQSLELFQQWDDREGIADALSGLGFVKAARGEYASGRSLLEESLAIKQTLNDHTDRSYLLIGLLILSANEQQLDEICRLMETNLARTRRDDLRSVGLLLFYLGVAGYLKKDYATARTKLNESLQICQTLGDKWTVSRILWGLGSVAFAVAEYETAQAAFHQSLTLSLQLHGTWEVCQVLEYTGFLAAELQQPERAVLLLGAASALRISLYCYKVPLLLPLYQHYEETLRSTLGADNFAALWTQSQSMTMDEAVAVAQAVSLPQHKTVS